MLLALTGVLGYAAAGSRAAAIDDIATRIDPLSTDTAAVYRALAAADAAVTSEFLAAGTAPGEPRARIDDDLAVAAAGLARAAGQTDDPATTDVIVALGTQLPAYAGTVELARTNAGRGAPAAAAELQRASEMMHSSILPAVETLLGRQAGLLDQAYLRAEIFPVAVLVLAVALALTTIAVQLWLARQFRRRLNAGMVIATGVLAVGALLWGSSTIASGEHLARSHAHSQAVSDALLPARIAALQTRSAAGLWLVATDDAARERRFDEGLQRLARDDGRSALGASAVLMADPTAYARVQDAIAAATGYRDTLEQVRRAGAEGRSADAVRLLRSADPAGATGAFGRLDAGLAAAIDAEHRAFTEQTRLAQAWHDGLGPLTVLLVLIAGGAAAVGITARLREYP